MQFANYTDFRTAVLKMIEGSDQVTSSISIDTLDMLIALGETYVYNGPPGLRSATMQAPLSLTVAANAVVLPSDCLAVEAAWLSPDEPLEAVSEEELRSKAKWNQGGSVRQYAMAGTGLIFGPTAANGTVLQGRYYRRPADLKTAGLNSTFSKYPEVFLFAALAKSAPFIGDDERIPMWEMQFTQYMNSANTLERNFAYMGSRLRQRAR